MTALVFVDTNVLVYAEDKSDAMKHDLAHEWIDALWARRAGRLSTQVLNEYYVTVTRKFQRGMKQGDVRAKVRRYQSWQPLQVDHRTVETAWGFEARFDVNYWDALILASAQQAGCATLLSEDLQHGQKFGQLMVVDPFRVAPSELFSPNA